MPAGWRCLARRLKRADLAIEAVVDVAEAELTGGLRQV